MSPNRRDFLKVAAAVVAIPQAASTPQPPAPAQAAGDVIVIGAGAFGGWTAYYLATLGAKVTLVDAYGPGNSRATSGDETRGIRTSYGDRGIWAELWTGWANEAITRWKRFDEEWGREMKVRLFFNTGDFIFRARRDSFMDRNQELWKKSGIPFEVPMVEDIARSYPVINLREITVATYEPRAGVVRARRACEVMAEAFRQAGGEVVLGYASPGDRNGRRLENVKTTGPTATLRADKYVFALGPWFPKAFPDLMAPRIRTPIGYVHYFGTPPGDDRFTFPNMPSFNFPGVTGWPALPPDNRGFRVRLRGDIATDPDVSQRVFDREKDRVAHDFVRQRFPLLRGAPLLETRACHYEMSASRNFIIDRHPQFDNVWFAGGGSAEGFKFGPVVGEYVAKRVAGLETDEKLAEAFSLKMSETLITSNTSGAPASSLTGVYSQAQARRGAETYRRFCSACHTPASHSGDSFRTTWTGRSAGELFDYLRTTMPDDKPGRLSRAQYADIVSYLLQLNGMPAGAQPLSADPKLLGRIRIAGWSSR
ncbi:MAG TPA: FAD-dependent oxidoreductase [Terriglobia bacterium]|nr:FAD-dependent oxidoreductase [Terriglobia bacterium]